MELGYLNKSYKKEENKTSSNTTTIEQIRSISIKMSFIIEDDDYHFSIFYILYHLY
jgi:hypothetical protein